MDVNGALPGKIWNNKNGGFLYLQQFTIITVWKRLQCCKVHFMTENNIIHIHGIHLYLQNIYIYIIYTYNKYIEMHLCVCVCIYIYTYFVWVSISLSLRSTDSLTLAFLPRLCCHGESMWFPGVAMGISSLNSSSAIIRLSFYDLLLFSLSITLLSFFPCDCWSSLLRILGWDCEGQLMSLDSLVTRMKVFSGWPWVSVTSLAFSLLSHTDTNLYKWEYTLSRNDQLTGIL